MMDGCRQAVGEAFSRLPVRPTVDASSAPKATAASHAGTDSRHAAKASGRRSRQVTCVWPRDGWVSMNRRLSKQANTGIGCETRFNDDMGARMRALSYKNPRFVGCIP